MTEAAFVRAVRRLYLALPGAPQSFSASDRRLALDLYRRPITFDTLRGALLLATARRRFRSPDLPRLTSVRSLAYFLPVVEELLRQPLPNAYLDYLAAKLRS